MINLSKGIAEDNFSCNKSNLVLPNPCNKHRSGFFKLTIVLYSVSEAIQKTKEITKNLSQIDRNLALQINRSIAETQSLQLLGRLPQATEGFMKNLDSVARSLANAIAQPQPQAQPQSQPHNPKPFTFHLK